MIFLSGIITLNMCLSLGFTLADQSTVIYRIFAKDEDAIFVNQLASSEITRLWCLVQAPEGYLLLVNPIQVDFSNNDCASDYMTITDDRYYGTEMVKLCGARQSNGVYTTTGNRLTILYSAANPKNDNSIKLLITKYNLTQDDASRFRCDNSRYIGQSLRCDGWNNCGDNSDENQATCSAYPVVPVDDHCGDMPLYLSDDVSITLTSPPNVSLLPYCRYLLAGTDSGKSFIVMFILGLLSNGNCTNNYLTAINVYPSASKTLTTFCNNGIRLYVENPYFPSTEQLIEWYISEMTIQADSSINHLTLLNTNARCDKDSQFTCGNGHCISRSYNCNGQYDCGYGDNSDEESGCSQRIQCTDDQFKCSNVFCIDNSLVCDGNNDCCDNSDERGCLEVSVANSTTWARKEARKRFQCNNRRCIDPILKCNGYDNCGDSSDENLPDMACPVRPTTTKVGNTGHCDYVSACAKLILVFLVTVSILVIP